MSAIKKKVRKAKVPALEEEKSFWLALGERRAAHIPPPPRGLVKKIFNSKY